jgi:HK97 gp10 family phage protein
MPAIKAKLKIEGLDAVKKAFKDLEPKIARKVISQAERKALAPIKAAIIAGEPKRTGDLRRSVRIRTAKGPRRSGKKTIAMGLLVGAGGSKGKKGKKTGQAPWWAFLIEWGWIVGKRVRSAGKVVGRSGSGKKIPGKHVARKAMRSHEAQAQKIMTSEILAGIEREAHK